MDADDAPGNAALLVVDAQVNMFASGAAVHESEHVLDTLVQLVVDARAAHVPVIYIQNDGGELDPDPPGSPGWALHPRLGPEPGEVVVRKSTPDAFEGTLLGALLGRLKARRLIVAGMQTQYCVNTTVRRAAALGYRVTLVADGHSTYDERDEPAAAIIARVGNELGAVASVVPAAELEW